MFSVKRVSEIETKIQEFILSGFMPFPKNTVGLISSKGGLGKTNLSLKLTSEFINSHTGNVALWLTEDEEGNIKYRFDSLLKAGIIEPFNEERALLFQQDPIHFAKLINREFITDNESLNNLKLFCIENDIKLFIIDPLLAFYGGNENDNSQARVFMQPFINWCKEIDINIIFIHHGSKGDNSTTRGAGAFIDAVRCAYSLSVPLTMDKKHLVVDELKVAQGYRVIECIKDNRGAIAKIHKLHGGNPFETKVIPKLDDDSLKRIETKMYGEGKQIAENILSNAGLKKEPESVEFSDISMPSIFGDDND